MWTSVVTIRPAWGAVYVSVGCSITLNSGILNVADWLIIHQNSKSQTKGDTAPVLAVGGFGLTAGMRPDLELWPACIVLANVQAENKSLFSLVRSEPAVQYSAGAEYKLSNRQPQEAKEAEHGCAYPLKTKKASILHYYCTSKICYFLGICWSCRQFIANLNHQVATPLINSLFWDFVFTLQPINSTFFFLSPSRPPRTLWWWTRSWRTWTRIRTARWTSRSLWSWWRHWPWPAMSSLWTWTRTRPSLELHFAEWAASWCCVMSLIKIKDQIEPWYHLSSFCLHP